MSLLYFASYGSYASYTPNQYHFLMLQLNNYLFPSIRIYTDWFGLIFLVSCWHWRYLSLLHFTICSIHASYTPYPIYHNQYHFLMQQIYFFSFNFLEVVVLLETPFWGGVIFTLQYLVFRMHVASRSQHMGFIDQHVVSLMLHPFESFDTSALAGRKCHWPFAWWIKKSTKLTMSTV